MINGTREQLMDEIHGLLNRVMYNCMEKETMKIKTGYYKCKGGLMAYVNKPVPLDVDTPIMGFKEGDRSWEEGYWLIDGSNHFDSNYDLVEYLGKSLPQDVKKSKKKSK